MINPKLQLHNLNINFMSCQFKNNFNHFNICYSNKQFYIFNPIKGHQNSYCGKLFAPFFKKKFTTNSYIIQNLLIIYNFSQKKSIGIHLHNENENKSFGVSVSGIKKKSAIIETMTPKHLYKPYNKICFKI